MTTVSKKLTACLLSVVMLLGILLLIEPAYAYSISGGDTMVSATPIDLDTSYSDSTSLDQESNWYSFTLPSSGRITINLLSTLDRLNVYLYDSNGAQLLSETLYREDTTGQLEKLNPMDLTKGTYYLRAERWYFYEEYLGSYTFDVDFVSIGESFTETGFGTNNTYPTASSISLNKTYTGQIARNDECDWYCFTLPSSGRTTFDIASKIGKLCVGLYDNNGEHLMSKTLYREDSTGQLEKLAPLDLTKGTYYLCAERYSTYFEDTGKYTLKVAFTSAGESFTETGFGINNTTNTASAISLNKTYTGQLAYNDEYDWYRFTLPSSGRISIDLTSKISILSIQVYSSDADKLWNWRCYRDDDLEQLRLKQDLDLTKGTYYIRVERNSQSLNDTGVYSFKVAFTSAGESFSETGYGTNNTTSRASSISLNKTYTGQIALNDDKDFYKFKLSAKGELNLNIHTKMDAVNVYFYDRNGNQLFAKTAYKNSTTGTNRAKFTVAVPAGTSYVGVTQNGSNTGTYTFSLQRAGVPTAPKVTSSYFSASGKPYLKWASVEYASKYEVYRASSKSGTYKKIGTTSKVNYTDTSATAGYTYYYKVKAVNSKGSASGYSAAVSAISHCARPVAKSDYLTSTGKPYVKWSAVTGASKYQVYRSTSKTGTYKLLGTTTKLNYTDTSATTGYTYYYKVKAVSKVKTSANSAYSTPISIICHCAKPVVKITTSGGDPRLTWSTVTGASKYEVYRATSSGGTYTKVATTTAKTYTDKTAKAGKTYYYKVKAVSKVKASANSAYSAVKSIKAK